MAHENELPDDLNPQYIYSLTATQLLSKIVKGEIDPKAYAAQELANRGLDQDGKWCGFDKAAKIHERQTKKIRK